MLAILSRTNLQDPIFLAFYLAYLLSFKRMLGGLTSFKNTIRIDIGLDHLATLVWIMYVMLSYLL